MAIVESGIAMGFDMLGNLWPFVVVFVVIAAFTSIFVFVTSRSA